jgi:hypothetical protein
MAARSCAVGVDHGFAVVIITARRLPVDLPRDMKPFTSAVYYNSSQTNIAQTKANQLKHARDLFAGDAPLEKCVLIDDDPSNIATVFAMGASAVQVSCGQVTPDLVKNWVTRS